MVSKKFIEPNQSSEFNESTHLKNYILAKDISNEINESHSLSQAYCDKVIKQLDRIYHDELVRYALELKEHQRIERRLEHFQQIDKQMDWCLSQIEEEFNSIPKVVEIFEFGTMFETKFPSLNRAKLQVFHQTKLTLREKKIKAHLYYKKLQKVIYELSKKQADQDLQKLQIKQEIFTIKQKFANLLEQSDKLGRENAELVNICNKIDNQLKATFEEKKKTIVKLDQTVREMFDLESEFERSLNEIYIEAISSKRKAVSDKRLQERESIFAQMTQVQHNIEQLDQKTNLIQFEMNKSDSENESPSNLSQLILYQTTEQRLKNPKKVFEARINDFN